MSEIFERASEVIASCTEREEVTPGSVSPESRMRELLPDSLDRMACLIALEEEFGIAIDDTEYREADTVLDVVRIVEECMS